MFDVGYGKKKCHQFNGKVINNLYFTSPANAFRKKK